jgi:ribosome maturation factor RimP
MKDDQIAGVLTPVLSGFGLDLEAVEIIPAGKRRLVRIVVDGDGPYGRGPLLDDIAEASRALSEALDATNVTGAAAYTLEVSSRGVSRPLELPRHWRRNIGRLIAVTLVDGDAVTGRIVGSGEESAELEVDGAVRVVAYADIAKALVQVELNRRDHEGEGEDD